MNLPQNVNAVKFLDGLAKQGIRGTVMGTEFLPEKPLTQAQFDLIQQAIATHDPSPTLAQKRQNHSFRQAEYADCKTDRERLDCIARVMGLIKED